MLGARLQRLVPSKSFARNVATLSGATALSQLLAFCALPIITRLYSPEAFGAAGAFAGIIALIGVVGALRYELALSLPRSDRAAWHVAILSLGILGAVVAATWICALIALAWWTNGLGLPNWAYSTLLAVGVAALGGYQIASFWAVRKSNFPTIARTRIQQGVTGPVVQIGLGLTGFGVVGLILGQILALSGGVIRLASALIADNRKTGLLVHRRGLAWAAKRYRRFPLYDGAASLLNIAGAQAPIILVAALFSPVLAGYYALAYRFLSAPLGLIGKAISQVLLPRIVQAGRGEEGSALVLRLLKLLSWLSFVPFTIVALLSAEFVPILFGADWVPASNTMAWTALWVAWQFVTSPLSTIMPGLEAVRLQLGVQLALFLLRVVPILIGAWLGSSDVAVIGFSVGGICGYIIYLIAICSVVGVGAWGVVRTLALPIGFSAVCAGAVAGLTEHAVAEYVFLAVASAVWLGRLLTLTRNRLA